MLADIVEGADLAVMAAHHDDRLMRDIIGKIAPLRRQCPFRGRHSTMSVGKF
jgi:hypothetical protein